MRATYLDAIDEFYPEAKVKTSTPEVYESLIVLEGTLPPKEDLDERILEITRARVWEEIKKERERRRTGGIKVGDDWFHTDDTSRIQYVGILLMGANLPPGIMWKTLANDFVEMTPSLGAAIFQGIGAADVAIFGAAEFHRAQVNVSEEPHLYDYTTGWPLTFGEEE